MTANFVFCCGLVLGWTSMAAFLAVLMIPTNKEERKDDGYTGNDQG